MSLSTEPRNYRQSLSIFCNALIVCLIDAVRIRDYASVQTSKKHPTLPAHCFLRVRAGPPAALLAKQLLASLPHLQGK